MGNTTSSAIHRHGNGGAGTSNSNAAGTSSPPRDRQGATTGSTNAQGLSNSEGQQRIAGVGGAGPSLAGPGAPASESPKDEGNKALAAMLFPQEARVDNGHLLPLSNIYPTSAQDWLHDVVQKLIIDRKLAPFYRGLEDWNDDKETTDSALDNVGDDQSKSWRKNLYRINDRKAEAAMYKKATECPICFL